MTGSLPQNDDQPPPSAGPAPSSHGHSDESPSESAYQEFNRIVFAFEDAWQTGTPPDVAAFLPPSEPLRIRVLRELVKIDFEYRRERGDSPVAADYLTRFPELSMDTEQLRSLVTWFKQCAAPDRNQPKTDAQSDAKAACWPSIKPNTVLGNYTILELIGEGGMGAVFKARHQHMNRIVALKTISRTLINSQEAIQRFHREVRAAARLDHPNIVTAHDADQFNDLHVLVMQYVDGCDLARVVRKEGPLSVDLALDYIRQTAAGLEYAHRNGVIHRDIKPSNLMVSQSGQIKILDMGLARFQDLMLQDKEVSRELTLTGEFVGTADFMSPEQALDPKNAGVPSDVYSLGCTLYYVLTGRFLFGGKSFVQRIMAHRDLPTPQLREVRPDVSKWLEAVFQRMIAKNPDDRFQTMTELLKALASGDAQVGIPSNGGISSSHSIPSFASNSSLNRPVARFGRKSMTPSLIAAAVATFGVIYFGWTQFNSFSAKPPNQKGESAVGAAGDVKSIASTTQQSLEQSGAATQASESSRATDEPPPTMSPLQITLTAMSIADLASDSRYSVLVNNGILLSPENEMFDDDERQMIRSFQNSPGKTAGSLTLFFSGRLQWPADGSSRRLRNVSPEDCLAAWIAMREGQRPERLDVPLQSHDVTIDSKGASAVNLVVVVFPKNEGAAEYLGTKGLACKVIPVQK